MNAFTRRALLGATILTPAMMIATSAHAQSSDNEEPVSIASEDTEDDNRIIVTARKKSEDLQEVPTSVAVVTSETITNLALDSLEEIANTTPGLFFDESFGRNGNRPVIRGQANILGESGVAFFIDGIYYTGSLADYDVDTIERLEVVKGPQSALYGRNTYSGAINIISKQPTDTLQGRLSIDVAEHDRYEITGGIRGPITDGLGFGINGRYYDFGGEFTNEFDGEKVGQQSSWSLSGLLDWDNGGPFTATARAYYNRTDDGQPAIFQQGTEENNCFIDNGSFYNGRGRYFCGTIEPGEINTDYSRQFIDESEVGLEADTYNISLRMDYEVSDSWVITSLTGYNDRTETQLTDGDYSPTSFQPTTFATFPVNGGIGIVNGQPVDFSFANRSEVSDWSQELRLTYASDAFDFLIGGYFFDQSSDSFSIRELPADAEDIALEASDARAAELCSPAEGCFFSFYTSPQLITLLEEPRDETLTDIENIAVFGAVNWHVTPEFNIGIEGRYAEEKVSQTTFGFNEGQDRPDPVSDSETFKAFTPRVTLDWQVSPDNLLYAIYAEGQKPGGFNGALAKEAEAADPTLDIATYDPEDNTTYEIGLKNTFADGRVTINLAAYFTEVEGYQLTQNVSVPPNQISVITNAGDAEIIGLEAEFVGRITRNFTLTMNYALASSEFTDGVDENQGVLNDVADDGLVNCSTGDEFPDVDGCQSAFGSIEGKSIPRAPEHRVFADLDYRADLGSSDWQFFTGANVTLTSSSFAQVHNEAKTGDAVEVDARLGFTNGTYRVQFYVDNLFDEDAVQQVLRYADADNSFQRSFIAGLRPGRRFGVNLLSTF
ncbi:MAG: TonB-dependent receptor [Erythrobacter sp.]|uniref:TonB-dependent receptor n=1 Tax=Erythrobacter sp. TaxID=1042 RepID=UPI00262A67E8|nr:TonB-dependent receptor [Erythrobacter sp.]MDJ0977630.1 TonB-dependent receptor [Erythrobacter sp.]